MMFRDTPPLVMGLHATSRGFGWALFEGPSRPLDWSLTFIKSGDKNAESLRSIKMLLERFRPEILVFERFDGRTGRRANRMGQLHREIAKTADSLGVSIETYTRRKIRCAMGLESTATRHDVAESVSLHIEAIRRRMPPERKPWDGSDRRMALFNAIALILTAYTELD